MAYKYASGQPFIYPRNDLKYSANFLHTVLRRAAEEYEVDPALASAMSGSSYFMLTTSRALPPPRAPRRIVGSQPVRLHLSRHRLCGDLCTAVPTRRC